MKIREGISWILDRPESEIEEMKKKWSGDEYRKHYFVYAEEKYRRNIDFVHSLGLKCDCVGWCSLDLDRPDIGEILDKIEAFCKGGGWLARGGYGRSITDFESDWYQIAAPELDDFEPHYDDRCERRLHWSAKFADPEYVELHKERYYERGERKDVYAIRAYKNRGLPLLLGYGRKVPAIASERFRDAVIRNKIGGVDFCWIRDVGRYESEQYAFLYPEQRITRIACGNRLHYSDGKYASEHDRQPHHPGSPLYRRYEELGGYLPRMAEIFYDFGVNLPDYYCKNEMPEGGFAVVQGMNEDTIRDTLLVHRDAAEILLREKVLKPQWLMPVPFYEETVPPGYREVVLDSKFYATKPEQQHFEEMELEYREITKRQRPKRKATEKQATKALRLAKQERKEDFQKRMKKELLTTLEESIYAPLAPYYSVADGGHLSDEYRMLSYAEVEPITSAFRAKIAKEELLDASIEGMVFAICPDGDRVILRPDGTVARVSHEVPEITEEWPSIAQFVVDEVGEDA